MNRILAVTVFVLVSALSLSMPAQAAGVPEVKPTIKKMLGALPISGLKDVVHKMIGELKATGCGAELTGCYTTSTVIKMDGVDVPLKLYFFTSRNEQQTFFLVINRSVALPKLLKDNIQKILGGTKVTDMIISISTSDFALDTIKMPQDLQAIVQKSYFNVGSLYFSPGVQFTAQASLGKVMAATMNSLGVRADQFTIRAGVVMPIPTDLASGAGAGAGLAMALKESETMKKAGADAAKLEAYVEFQLAPNANVTLGTPRMTLTDATFSLNNVGTFGFNGNASFEGVPNKTILVQFQTPLDPAGALDLLDFSFRMATPANFTMEDAAHVMVALSSTDPRLARYGGGFIRNIASFKQPLLAATQPLSVFKLQNPVQVPVYRFGDSSKPWPANDKAFNIVVLGPLADGGPFMRAAGEVNILGQKMGWLDASAGASGLHGAVGEALTLKLGPLGKVRFRMEALADVDMGRQDISLKGNLAGQKVEVTLAGSTMSVHVNATCENPFEIDTQRTIEANTDIAKVFEGLDGVNVDPSKLPGCVGKELEAAYSKIAGEYKNLSGYTASAANRELKKISDAAAAAAATAKAAKDTARNVANQSTNAANQALKAAGNAFKGFGKKKHRNPPPDPRFASSVFDWDDYYDYSPDVVKANADLSTHWRDHGFREGRRGSLEFHTKYYRTRYSDVQALCGSSDYDCIVKHWVERGLPAGRQGSPDFSVADYIARHSDLRDLYGNGDYLGAMEHWHDHGQDEGRNARPASSAAGPLMGPVRIGGDGGDAWSDGAVCNGEHVIGWRLYAGRLVDRVQFRYPGGWAPAQSGSGDMNVDVTLTSGEYVVRVNYRSGGGVDSLSFHTNKGRNFGPYGGGGGSPGTFEVTPGQKLGCMQGRSGKYTDQLTFSSTGLR